MSPYPGGFHALAHALADDVALHLDERGLVLQNGATRRRGGVHGRVEGAESDVAFAEFVDEGDELADETSHSVEIEDDQRVAATPVVETHGQISAIRPRAPEARAS